MTEIGLRAKIIPDTQNYVYVSWSNRYHFGKECINTPITHEDKCIGVITDVDENTVYGRIFAEALQELK